MLHVGQLELELITAWYVLDARLRTRVLQADWHPATEQLGRSYKGVGSKYTAVAQMPTVRNIPTYERSW